jgi:hypothetical protein
MDKKNSKENIGYQYSDENLKKKILDTNILIKKNQKSILDTSHIRISLLKSQYWTPMTRKYI